MIFIKKKIAGWNLLVKGTDHDPVFQISLFSILADIFAV